MSVAATEDRTRYAALRDARIYIEAGKTDAEVRDQLAQNNRVLNWQMTGDEIAETIEEVRGRVNLTVISSVSNDGPDWPEAPAVEAFHGLAGEVVAAIEPHTEADPVGVLAQFLTIAGCQMGSAGHLMLGEVRHNTRLFTAIVGDTAMARKGESFAAAWRIPRDADLTFRKVSGLASGEALIHEVRDPVEKFNEKTGKMMLVDPGVADKRLLLVEPELSRLLRSMNRQGNISSAVIRSVWDSGDLQVTAKSTGAAATGAHVAIIGHITRDELAKEMSEVDATGGLFNRFLWVAVRRSKVLPFPEPLDERTAAPLREALRRAITSAGTSDRMKLSNAARAIYAARYEGLTTTAEGILGSIMTRAAPQVIRLAMVYARLDRAEMIGADHLTAALAFWDYSRRSAEFIFGTSGTAAGDPVADKIERALRELGPTKRSDVYSNVFKRNLSAARMELGFAVLVREHRARRTLERRIGGGKSTEIWMLA